MKRSQRGSESRSATATSTIPTRAQNRSSSHTVMSTALTVEPERTRPPRIGVASTQCLKRASSPRPTLRQSTPSASHQPRNSATRPA